jgi:hypothetical protein
MAVAFVVLATLVVGAAVFAYATVAQPSLCNFEQY